MLGIPLVIESAVNGASLETEPWVVAAAIFGGRAGSFVQDLDGVLPAPDLVIHDAMEMAGPIIAARAGVPRVTHGSDPRWPMLTAERRARHPGSWGAG